MVHDDPGMEVKSFSDVELADEARASGSRDALQDREAECDGGPPQQTREEDDTSLMQSAKPPWRRGHRGHWEDDRRRRRTSHREKRTRSASREKKGKAKGKGVRPTKREERPVNRWLCWTSRGWIRGTSSSARRKLHLPQKQRFACGGTCWASQRKKREVDRHPWDYRPTWYRIWRQPSLSSTWKRSTS